jgi:hypothetical protein
MSRPDPFHAEFAARVRGAVPRLPLWGDSVRWGGRRYHVAASDSGSAVLCPHAGCAPFVHEHLRLGALALAVLRWDPDGRAFRVADPGGRK